ncbi:methylmalonate-semialdehyde dehydrogenase [Klebsiella michiganensis]|uniref:Methylmalonate-semialdehyde dehydrogenase n=1 Tax=Klebsiella michiganensis TaxID=1134687 RepID=A0A7H4PQQ1_9ENTR|nr:methylmalonate-semialdehyde dehydrogenase [Klebsiella michiganensis]
MTCMEITKLYQEAGVPDGVINVVTCSRNEADILLTHPDVNGVSFVGSTSVGLHVLLQSRRSRQARSGTVRSEKPCPGAGRCAN